MNSAHDARPVLEVDGLTKRFGAVAASDGLSFSVADGETHALIGPNGAGKTTAIAQIFGEIQPDSGRVIFAGRDITRLPTAARARLGLQRSYQITSLLPEFTVADNVAMAVQAKSGRSFAFWRPARLDPELREPAAAVLAQVGLDAVAHEIAGRLSHGQQRQLELAMVLATEPRVVLLDEPMAGLGSSETQAMTAILKSVARSMTILLVEHDMDVVFALADRITVLAKGEVLASGLPDEIRNDRAVRAAYLGDE